MAWMDNGYPYTSQAISFLLGAWGLKAALMLINSPLSFLSPNFSLLEALPSFQLISAVCVCQDTSCSMHGTPVKSCLSQPASQFIPLCLSLLILR